MARDAQGICDVPDLLVRGDRAVASRQLPYTLRLDVARIGDPEKADPTPLPGELEDLTEVVQPQRSLHIGSAEDLRR
ncbi:hypothetical protein ACFQ6Q_18815 [Streptomyces sp. NPDC056437]|uniref:hypothetical protein n=1 Tax=Streptomyces sp. NPDC056437 TaxID=3345816 RepID=UPI0036A16DF6